MVATKREKSHAFAVGGKGDMGGTSSTVGKTCPPKPPCDAKLSILVVSRWLSLIEKWSEHTGTYDNVAKVGIRLGILDMCHNLSGIVSQT